MSLLEPPRHSLFACGLRPPFKALSGGFPDPVCCRRHDVACNSPQQRNLNAAKPAPILRKMFRAALLGAESRERDSISCSASDTDPAIPPRRAKSWNHFRSPGRIPQIGSRHSSPAECSQHSGGPAGRARYYLPSRLRSEEAAVAAERRARPRRLISPRSHMTRNWLAMKMLL